MGRFLLDTRDEGRLAWKMRVCTMSSCIREKSRGGVSKFPLDASQKKFYVLTSMMHMHRVANM